MNASDKMQLLCCFQEWMIGYKLYENVNGNFLIRVDNKCNYHFIRCKIVDSVKTFSLSIFSPSTNCEKIEFITNDVESFIQRYFIPPSY